MSIWDDFERPYVPYVPPVPPACTQFHHTLTTYGIIIARNGTRQIRTVCESCGWVGTHSWGHARFTDEERSALAVVRDNRTRETARCEVCNAPEVELHHFAPVHLFGWEEADRWPTAWLCPDHHREWHRIVTPAMRRRDVG